MMLKIFPCAYLVKYSDHLSITKNELLAFLFILGFESSLYHVPFNLADQICESENHSQSCLILWRPHGHAGHGILRQNTGARCFSPSAGDLPQPHDICFANVALQSLYPVF